MKRLIGLTLAVALLAGIPIAHHTIAAPPETLTVCHVTMSFERPNGIVFMQGMVQEIPEPSWEGHHKGHGDVLITDTLVTPPACCAFSVLANGEIVPGQVD